MIVRVMTEDGVLTYEAHGAVRERFGLGNSSLSRWRRAGAVRTRKVRGRLYYSLLDVFLLAAGLYRGPRVPEEERAYNHRHWVDKQQATVPTASQRGEPWDLYDLCRLVDMIEQGHDHQTCAITLERTLAAVNLKVEDLRRSGDLPPATVSDRACEEALDLLTDAERAVIAERAGVAA